MTETMSKTDMAKELERYRSMDKHSMDFFYKKYKFRYVETRGNGCVITISEVGDPPCMFEKFIRNITTLPKSKRTFETWCICWSVDYEKELEWKRRAEEKETGSEE